MRTLNERKVTNKVHKESMDDVFRLNKAMEVLEEKVSGSSEDVEISVEAAVTVLVSEIAAQNAIIKELTERVKKLESKNV